MSFRAYLSSLSHSMYVVCYNINSLHTCSIALTNSHVRLGYYLKVHVPSKEFELCCSYSLYSVHVRFPSSRFVILLVYDNTERLRRRSATQ